MKAYTFALGALRDGITVTNGHDLERGGVLLGNMNDKNYSKRVSLYKKNPAIVMGGTIRHASLKGIYGDKYHVLENNMRDESQSALLRVNCLSINPENKFKGSWARERGYPKSKVTANGLRSSGVTYCDDLIVMGPNDAILVHSESSDEGFEIYNKPGVGLKVKLLEPTMNSDVEDIENQN